MSVVARIASTLTCSVLIGTGLVAVAGPTQAATTTAFTTPGAKSFRVPSGITVLHVVATGGGGGGGNVGDSAIGGSGGTVTADIPVAPGQVMNIFVGAGGRYAAGPGTGGGSTNVNPGTPLQVIAGGGGGAGNSRTGADGGDGNAGGSPGEGGSGGQAGSDPPGFGGFNGIGGGVAFGIGASPGQPGSNGNGGRGGSARNPAMQGGAGIGDGAGGAGSTDEISNMGGGGGGGYGGGGGGGYAAPGVGGSGGGAGGSTGPGAVFGTASNGGAVDGGAGSVFLTYKDAQVPLFSCVKPPRNLRKQGSAVIEKSRCVTNAGQKVSVKVTSHKNGGYRLTGRNGRNGKKVTLYTFGNKKLTITWTAPAIGGFAPYSLTRTYH